MGIWALCIINNVFTGPDTDKYSAHYLHAYVYIYMYMYMYMYIYLYKVYMSIKVLRGLPGIK